MYHRYFIHSFTGGHLFHILLIILFIYFSFSSIFIDLFFLHIYYFTLTFDYPIFSYFLFYFCYSFSFVFPIFSFHLSIHYSLSFLPFAPPIVTFLCSDLLLFVFPIFPNIWFLFPFYYSLMFCHWDCCCSREFCLLWFHFLYSFHLFCQDLYNSI